MLPPSHRLFPPVIQKVEGKKSLGCHQYRWLSKATLNRHLRRSKRCAGRFGQVELTPILSANLTPKPKQVTCSFENLTLITQNSASVQLLLRSSGLESQLSAARLTFPPKLAGRALSWLASLAGWGQGLKKLIKTALINGNFVHGGPSSRQEDDHDTDPAKSLFTQALKLVAELSQIRIQLIRLLSS